LPAVQKVREAAARMSCQNNLKQIGLACYSYENVYQVFPNAFDNNQYTYTYYNNLYYGSRPGPGSWLAVILPYIEQNNLLNAPLLVDGTQSPPVKTYYCPSEPRAYPIIVAQPNADAPEWNYFSGTDYVAIMGVDYYDRLGIIAGTGPSFGWFAIWVRVTDVTDGTSNTIMVGERPPKVGTHESPGGGGDWNGYLKNVGSGAALQSAVFSSDLNGNPCPALPYYFGAGPRDVNNPCSINQLWSNHTGGGANFVIGDGSVRFISYSAASIMPALATRAGGEVAEVP
jgi:hypothetical protein